MGTEKARGPIWGPGGLPGEGGEQADSRATQEREGVHGGAKQGNRPSCRHQEGRSGSAEAVLGTSMFQTEEEAGLP